MRTNLFLGCLISALAWAAAAPAQSQKTYEWTVADCAQSPIAPWPGLTCKATNQVVSEGNVGAFRRWSAYGNTSEGYVHIFLWQAQNNFSYITTDETTADFIKWMYEHGQQASQFSPVSRYRDADYITFMDGQNSKVCSGFRRTGSMHRGGYEWIMGGILCAPPGRQLTTAQVNQFIDRVQLRNAPVVYDRGTASR